LFLSRDDATVVAARGSHRSDPVAATLRRSEADAMAHDPVIERVEKLEKTVAALTSLPGEVSQLSRRVGTMESQIVQLRTEMKGEFSAVRGELAEVRGGLAEVRGGLAEVRSGLADVRGGLAEVRGDLAETRDNLLGVIESGSQATQQMFNEVRQDIGAFRQETNTRFDGLSTQMRVLHEDVIERISRLGGR
jgi:chromosome segregation ATPase